MIRLILIWEGMPYVNAIFFFFTNVALGFKKRDYEHGSIYTR